MSNSWLQPNPYFGKTVSNSENQEGAFTLVELLVSSVVLLVAVIGSIAAFNLITQSVRGTGIRAEQSRIIDADIADITQLSELYTSCMVARGSFPVVCAGVSVAIGNSFYYFPDPDNASFVANRAAFFDSCSTNNDPTHITAAFITQINQPVVPPRENVTRQPAVRIAPGVGNNHLVRIIWTDPTRNDRELRSIVTYPIVSSWCP